MKVRARLYEPVDGEAGHKVHVIDVGLDGRGGEKEFLKQVKQAGGLRLTVVGFKGEVRRYWTPLHNIVSLELNA